MQLSDMHFGTEQPAVVEALVALALQQRPDLLVLSGDITQRARPAEFQAARAFMNRLGAPMLAIPGNHDIPLFNVWARLQRPYAGHMAAFGSELEPVYASPDHTSTHSPAVACRTCSVPIPLPSCASLACERWRNGGCSLARDGVMGGARLRAMA